MSIQYARILQNPSSRKKRVQKHTLAEITPDVDPRELRHDLLDCDTAFLSTRLSISTARATAGYFA